MNKQLRFIKLKKTKYQKDSYQSLHYFFVLVILIAILLVTSTSPVTAIPRVIVSDYDYQFFPLIAFTVSGTSASKALEKQTEPSKESITIHSDLQIYRKFILDKSLLIRIDNKNAKHRTAMLLLDISGSIGESGWQQAKKWIQSILPKLDQNNFVSCLGMFGDYFHIPNPCQQSSEEILSRLIKPHLSLAKTRLSEALHQAIQTLDSESVLFLITDGKDNGELKSLSLIVNLANKKGVVIHTLSLEKNLAMRRYSHAAMSTGGLFIENDMDFSNLAVWIEQNSRQSSHDPFLSNSMHWEQNAIEEKADGQVILFHLADIKEPIWYFLFGTKDATISWQKGSETISRATTINPPLSKLAIYLLGEYTIIILFFLLVLSIAIIIVFRLRAKRNKTYFSQEEIERLKNIAKLQQKNIEEASKRDFQTYEKLYADSKAPTTIRPSNDQDIAIQHDSQNAINASETRDNNEQAKTAPHENTGSVENMTTKLSDNEIIEHLIREPIPFNDYKPNSDDFISQEILRTQSLNLSDHYFLHIKTGVYVERIFPIYFLETILGKHEDATISLPDPYISNFHCKIKFINGDPILFDTLSQNGTYLNKHKLIRPKALENYDEIQLGKTVFIFRIK